MTMIGTQTMWTTERIALLKNRIDAGLSCGQIAREIGVSRNAVIGKANRLGLSRFRSAAGTKPERTGTPKIARPRIITQHKTSERCGQSRRLRLERCRATALITALYSNFSSGIAAGRSASRVPKTSASAGTRWSTACPTARRMPAWPIGRAGAVHSQIVDDAATVRRNSRPF